MLTGLAILVISIIDGPIGEGAVSSPSVLIGAWNSNELTPSIGEEMVILSSDLRASTLGSFGGSPLPFEIDIFLMSFLALGVVSSATVGRGGFAVPGVDISRLRKENPSTGETADIAIGVATADFEPLSLHPKKRPTDDTSFSEGDVTSLSFSCGAGFSVGKEVMSFKGEFFGVIRSVALGFDGPLIDRPRTNFWMFSVSDLVRECWRW